MNLFRRVNIKPLFSKRYIFSNSIKRFKVDWEMELEYNYTGEIALDETESKLFTLLKDVMAANESKTVMRVAGGWVRDKVKFQQLKNLIQKIFLEKKTYKGKLTFLVIGA
jgi:hypothetical protein